MSRFRRMSSVVLVVVLAHSVLAATVTSPPQDVAAGVIGGLVAQLQDLVVQAEQSAHSLLDHGDAVAAQQQTLLASVIRDAIEQVKQNYSSALGKTADALTTQEMNVKNDLDGLVAAVKGPHGAIPEVSGSLQARIEQSQTAANQLMDRVIPFGARYPILYGVQSRDLLASFDASPSDFRFFGYLLADPRNKYKPPTVMVESTPIPPANVSVTQGRIDVQLPDALRTALHLNASPCDPMKTLKVSLTVEYFSGGLMSSLWEAVGWSSKATFKAEVLPGAREYDYGLQVWGTSSGTREDSPRDFSVASSEVNFGCYDTATASISRQTFPGRIVSSSGRWEGISNAKSYSDPVVTPSADIFAVASITGLDKNFLGICPGGGHGHIVADGKFIPIVPYETAARFVAYGTVVPLGARTHFPEDGSPVWQKIRVTVWRKKCDRNVDELDLPLPSDANQRVHGTSKDGLFEVTIQRGDFLIVPTDKLKGM